MLDQLSEIVIETGKAVSRRRHQDATGGVWEGSQLKTSADLYAHQSLKEKLVGVEQIPVVSEEDPETHLNARPLRYWLIDPIDGTRSLVDGFPGWVTQAALIENGRPLMAAIYAPDWDLLYSACLGDGAYVNNRHLSIDNTASERIVLVDNYPEPRGIAAEAMEAIPCSDYIESGSISLKICRVADNTADLFFKDVVVRDWDVAAPMLVLQEAGGFLAQGNGRPFVLADDFEKQGVIATCSSELLLRTRDFLDRRGKVQP